MPNDTFDVYITKHKLNTNFLLTINSDGLNNLGSSQHAKMQISDENIEITGDNGKDIATLSPSQVLGIQDNQSGITITTKDGSLNLNFNNVRKGGIKMLLLGPLLASSSKDSPMSAVVQDKCKQAINSLSRHGYKLN
jgi:hypothetical protein